MFEFMQAVPSFALAAFLIALIPGQGMAMVLRQTMVGGRAVAFVSVLGNSSGLIVWGLGSAFGLSAIFVESEFAYSVLKFVGVGYLSFISIQTFLSLRNKSVPFSASGDVSPSLKSAYRVGLITNLTNPKAAVFALAILPGFIPKTVSVLNGIIGMSLVWAVVSFTTYAGVILTIHYSSELLSSEKARRRLTLLSAIGIAGMAIGLVFTN